MDAQFWINAWNEGRTNFHQQNYHEKLLQFFPPLRPHKGQSVLVPLCGKSKDMLWLSTLGLKVKGVELHQTAVDAFFSENKLQPEEKSLHGNFKRSKFLDITVDCGDFFKLSETSVFDFVYDRASLVALPLSMRKNYVQIISQALKPGGKCLLIVYDYDQSKMDGPPFSIDEKEIQSLYAHDFSITLLDSQQPDREGIRFSALESFKQSVYLLEKKGPLV